MRHIYMRGMAIVAALLMLAPGAAAQTEEKFKLRLTPVPLDGGMRATVTGSGSGSATLSGAKLAINGTFDGLKSPATIAKIHRGVATGVRGSAFLDLTVTKAMNGTFSGTFDLSPEQVDSLKKGKLYIQIHSEKAPEGNLWGWLLK